MDVPTKPTRPHLITRTLARLGPAPFGAGIHFAGVAADVPLSDRIDQGIAFSTLRRHRNGLL